MQLAKLCHQATRNITAPAYDKRFDCVEQGEGDVCSGGARANAGSSKEGHFAVVIPYLLLPFSSPTPRPSGTLKTGPTQIGNITKRCAMSRIFAWYDSRPISASVDPVRDKHVDKYFSWAHDLSSGKNATQTAQTRNMQAKKLGTIGRVLPVRSKSV